MYAAVSKHGGAPLLSLPVGSAQRAVIPATGPPTIDIAIEGHLGSASGIQMQRGRDAAILGELYLAHGLASLKKVDGSFAFLIVDHRDGSVHAGIDKLGQSLAYVRSEEHTSELQSRQYLVCRLLLEKKKYR